MTHPLDLPSFLDRRALAPTRAPGPEAAGGAVKAATAPIAGDPPCSASGPAAPAAGPTFPEKETSDTMAKTLKGDGTTSQPKTKNGRKKAKLMAVGNIKPEDIQRYSQRYHDLCDELEETQGTYRNDIKQVFDDAENAGIPRKLLKMALGKERGERKLQNKLKKMMAKDRDAFENIWDALGTFTETPLGEAAVRASGQKAPEPTHAAGTA